MASDFLQVFGYLFLVLAIGLSFYQPNAGMAFFGVSLMIQIFAKVARPVERKMIEQSKGGGGGRLLIAMIVVGVLFFLLLGGGSMILIDAAVP